MNTLRGRRGGCCGGYGGNSGGGLLGILVVIFLAVVTMPFVGGYVLITGKEDGSKLLGGVLLVVGIILWVALGIH